MKRSEMIEAIAKRLGPIGISYETCEEVLTILEEEGMMPPMTDIDFYHPAPEYEWEREDT